MGSLSLVNDVSTNYLIIEIEKTQERQNSYPSNSILINELVFYDTNDVMIPYTTTSLDAYDSVNNDIPYYWNNTSVHGRDNLNDGVATTNNSNSTSFLYSSIGDPENGVGWARLLIQFDHTVEISEISDWTGNENGLNRDLHIFKVFRPLSGVTYNKTQMIDTRNTDDLYTLWEFVNDLSVMGDSVEFSTDL